MPHRIIVNDNSTLIIENFTPGRDRYFCHPWCCKTKTNCISMEGSFRVLLRNDKTELLVAMKFIKSKLYLTQLLGRNENLL